MPEAREQTRLVKLQASHDRMMDDLVEEMFGIRAHTAEGRRAKVSVLLGCVLGDGWRGRDEETRYCARMAQTMLLISSPASRASCFAVSSRRTCSQIYRLRSTLSDSGALFLPCP